MKTFTGWEYLLIDAANHYGLDKLPFEERIAYMTGNLKDLEFMADDAETKPLYIKAVMAIRKAQQGIPTGHLVGLDACCSGIQVMSALTGCIAGATSTGMVDPDKRADAYSDVTNTMASILGNAVNVTRQQAKDATMHSFYGSKKSPKTIFGDKTPELAAFYEAANIIAPGPWDLLQDLLASWQPYALAHNWKLPDGFDARVKVMKKNTLRIEVDELDNASFTYEFYENEGAKSGLSNAANLVHSVDGYILRSMHRRCNYDREIAEKAFQAINTELNYRSMGTNMADEDDDNYPLAAKVIYYKEQYERSTLADTVILPHLNEDTVCFLDTEHLEKLFVIIVDMQKHPPFELVSVHDEFKAHANNMNQVRWMYREIMAEIAGSNLLDDLLGQIMGVPGTFNKLSFNLPDLIRLSNYALC